MFESMKIKIRTFDLNLAHEWAISGSAAKRSRTVILVELASQDGTTGLGESAPSSRYGETIETVVAFLKKVDPKKLSFDDVPPPAHGVPSATGVLMHPPSKASHLSSVQSFKSSQRSGTQ